MKADLLALRNVGGVVAVFAVVMLLLWTLIGQGFTTFLVPLPETAAEQFLGALSAHNYQAARDQLSADLRQQVNAEDLQVLVQSLEGRQQGIEDAHGQESQVRGETVRATALVRLGNQQEQTLEFPLEQEHGIWKLTSIDPVRQLAGE